MTRWNQNNRFFISVLLIISIVVWGVIIYQIFESVDSSQSNNVNGDFSSQLAPDPLYKNIATLDSIEISLEIEIRNPFQPVLLKENVKSRSDRTFKNNLLTTTIKTRPNFHLVGTLISFTEKNKAIFEFEDGKTRICSLGDTINGFLVSQITVSYVRVVFNGRSFKLALGEN